MPDYEGSLKTSLGLLDLVGPFLSPEILEREESVADLVVHLDESLGLLLLDQVLWELLHGSRDPVEEVPGPGDAAGDSWQVPDNWRIVLVLLVLVLNLVNLQSVVVEEDGVLGVQAVSEVVSVEDRLELSEKLQRIFDAGDDLEVLVDVVLQLGLDGGYANIELDEVSVEGVVAVVEQLVVLLPEGRLVLVEGLQDWSNTLQIVLRERLELLDGAEELDELGHSPAE